VPLRLVGSEMCIRDRCTFHQIAASDFTPVS
jgi:hypothetical protein